MPLIYLNMTMNLKIFKKLYDLTNFILMESLMEWKNNVRKISASFYVALPIDYCKFKHVKKDQIAIFTLNDDGTLMLKIRNPAPVVNLECEKSGDQR